jgi:hypothetical protein
MNRSWIRILGLGLITMFLVGVGCQKVDPQLAAAIDDRDLILPTPSATYPPGTEDDVIVSDFHDHLVKVAYQDPDLLVYTDVFFKTEINVDKFVRLFNEYSFQEAGDEDAISILYGDGVAATDLDSGMTDVDTFATVFVAQRPSRGTFTADDLKVGGFIALVPAVDALRLWDENQALVRGVAVIGTQQTGRGSFWRIFRPHDPLL